MVASFRKSYQAIEEEKCWEEPTTRHISELKELSAFHFTNGAYRTVKSLYWRILDIQQTLYGITHPTNAETMLLFAELYQLEKNTSSAKHFLVAALYILDQNNKISSVLLERILVQLYRIYRMTGDQKGIRMIGARLRAHFINQSTLGDIARSYGENLCEGIVA